MSDLIKISSDNVPQKSEKKGMFAQKPTKKGPDMQKMAKKHGLTASIILFVILVGVSLFLFRDAVNVGAEALANSYSAAFDSERLETYDSFYQSAYDRAEEKYHVSNRAIISIANVEKVEKLEVIEVYQKEYITRNRDETTGNVTAWIEVTGKGKFVVDLKAAEFIVDNEHCYVKVRVPYPELEMYPLQNVEEELFKDDFFNGSTSEGVHMTVDMLNEAVYKIKKSLMCNQYVYENAQNVAISMIENLVKELNPDIPDLIVEVEFMEC